MAKFSVVMLVSRSDDKFHQAINSVIATEPDEFLTFIDTKAIDPLMQTEVKSTLKDANATIHTQQPTLFIDRHKNLVENYHRALLMVKNPWVVKCDDDDLLLAANRHKILAKHAQKNVGIIHGDKLVDYPYWDYFKSRQFIQLGKSLVKPRLFYGSQPSNPSDVERKIYGACFINQQAFTQAHSYLDHGYYYDWKTYYWILRLGWTSTYVAEPFLLHRINPYPSPERKRLWGKWPQFVKELDQIEVA